jgi:hypothetical protein
MSVIEKLASTLNRRDEIPNLELAQQIAAKKDKKSIQELVELLNYKIKDVQNDAIKVLYEIGDINPSLIAGYTQDFITLLDNKNNRLQWGAMTAIHAVTLENPALVYIALPQILATAQSGSVITKDYAVNILIKLCSLPAYAKEVFVLLNEQLLLSATNQLPMYAERAMPIINQYNRKQFVATLTARLDEIEKESKRKRVEKVIKKIGSS